VPLFSRGQGPRFLWNAGITDTAVRCHIPADWYHHWHCSETQASKSRTCVFN